jgi:hypothetical protein
MKKIVTMALVFLSVLSLFVVFVPQVESQSSSQLTQIEVLSYSTYTSQGTGDFILVGEVRNNGSSIIGVARPIVYALNSSGQAIGEPIGSQIFASQLLPNQTAPFYCDFSPYSSSTGDLSWVQNVTEFYFRFIGSTKETDDSIGLRIMMHTEYLVGSNYTISGVAWNSGDKFAENAYIAATYYDTSGKVIGVGLSNYLANSFAPNATANFQFTVFDPAPQVSAKIASYTLAAVWEGASSTGPTPTPTSTPTSSPSSTASSSSSPSATASAQPTSSGNGDTITLSMTLIYEIIAVVVIVIAVVALALVLRRGKKAKA